MMSTSQHQAYQESMVVEEEHAGLRLDKFLTLHPSLNLSRERVQQLMKEGHIHINATPCLKASLKVVAGTVVTIYIPEVTLMQLPAWETPLDVQYEDDALLVINKPRGMLTHPTGQQQPDTLVNALLHYCKGSLSGINGVERPGIVHRLDRDTEGLIVVAKTDVAHRGLSEQLQAKTMRRSYYAIVQGVPPEAAGIVRIGIQRHPAQRNKMQADWAGKPAVTRYSVCETLNDKFAWIRCDLETGRTHQIRVHLSHLGHPLVGDVMYGTGLERNWPELPQEGQALQAFHVGFIHPVTGKAMAFELPKSEYLEAAWSTLAQRM
jgi:23S rRNA pseudouridine1911/1915/1917 synthase